LCVPLVAAAANGSKIIVAFDLIIAMKRDPTRSARESELPPLSPPVPTAVIEINGVFCKESALELTRNIEMCLRKPVETVMIRFEDIACEDPQSLVSFATWLQEIRDAGHDVRLVTGESHVNALLSEQFVSRDAVIDPAEVDELAHHRSVDTDR
jgi:hypothetical protein